MHLHNLDDKSMKLVALFVTWGPHATACLLATRNKNKGIEKMERDGGEIHPNFQRFVHIKLHLNVNNN